MTLTPTRPVPRLRCRKCGSKDVHPTSIRSRTRKSDHVPDVAVICSACDHTWWSKSRAAQALPYTHLEERGQAVTTWDEMPLKKHLTRPPLPE